MSELYRGRLLATQITNLLNGGSFPTKAYPFTARQSRLPRVKKDDLGTTAADVAVAAAGKTGDEQDRSSEILIYTIGVTVAANVGDADSATADSVEDLVEQIHDFLSTEANREITLEADSGELHHVANLELPFVNEPTFDVNQIRENGVFFSLTIFTYLIEKTRV